MSLNKRRITLGIFLIVLLGLSTLVLAPGPNLATRPTAAQPSGLGNSPRPEQARLIEGYGRIPLSFEANDGQTDGRVKFLSRGRGYTMFLTGNEAVLALQSRQSSVVSRQLPPTLGDRLPSGSADLFFRSAAFPGFFGQRTADLQNKSALPSPSPERQAPAVVRLKLVGANPAAKVKGLEELPGKSNYFIGNDPKKWRTNVPNYAKVKYRDIYPGVDLVYYGNQRQLEYDFVVAPGADPSTIRLDVGADGVRPDGGERRSPLHIDANGDLVVGTGDGEVRFHKPVVYQPRGPGKGPRNSEFRIENSELFEGRYLLSADNRIGFEVAAYDRTKPLVIDPVLGYSTYLGGSGNDYGQAIAVDAAGNAYVAGYAFSTDFPTASPFQAASAGGWDAFVTKLNSTGSALVYSTYLGGSDVDAVGDHNGIAVDAAGDAYVAGLTFSARLPKV
jgi:hypothetical protein